MDYVVQANSWNEQTIKSKVQKYYEEKFPENWLETNTREMRIAIADASTNKLTVEDKEKNKGKSKPDWFKRMDHGEHLGRILFKYMPELNLKVTGLIFNDLSSWIDD